MKENTLKLAAAAPLAALGAYANALLVPLIVAGVVMLFDYLTGLAAAWWRGEVSSRTGIVGIIKKVAYGGVVAVGMVVDWVIQTTAEHAGIDAGNFCYFALLVLVWLIVNECISILENVDKLGVPVPAFLMKMVKKLKSTAEAKGDGEAGRKP